MLVVAAVVVVVVVVVAQKTIGKESIQNLLVFTVFSASSRNRHT